MDEQPPSVVSPITGAPMPTASTIPIEPLSPTSPVANLVTQQNTVSNSATPEERTSSGAERPARLDAVGWNWGAFMFPFVWGIGHRVYRVFWLFVPLFNLYWIFRIGLNGTEWAWEKGNFSDSNSIKEIESPWQRAGFVYFWISIVGGVLYTLYILALINLAANALPGLISSANSKDAMVKSDVTQIGISVDSYKSLHGGSYPASLIALALDDTQIAVIIAPKNGKKPAYAYTSDGSSWYVVSGVLATTVDCPTMIYQDVTGVPGCSK